VAANVSVQRSSDRGETLTNNPAGNTTVQVDDRQWMEFLGDHTVYLGYRDFTGLQRSEEHTSELQSLAYLVCRLLLEKKKTIQDRPPSIPSTPTGASSAAVFRTKTPSATSPASTRTSDLETVWTSTLAS